MIYKCIYIKYNLNIYRYIISCFFLTSKTSVLSDLHRSLVVQPLKDRFNLQQVVFDSKTQTNLIILGLHIETQVFIAPSHSQYKPSITNIFISSHFIVDEMKKYSLPQNVSVPKAVSPLLGIESACFDSVSTFGRVVRKATTTPWGPHKTTHTHNYGHSTLLIQSNSSGTHTLDIWDNPGHFSWTLPPKTSNVPLPLMPHTFCVFVVCLKHGVCLTGKAHFSLFDEMLQTGNNKVK